MKYHCTVVLSEKKKKNEKVIKDYGSTENEGPKAKQFVFCWGFIVLKTVFNWKQIFTIVFSLLVLILQLASWG